jgi:hypothetical protein
VNGWALLVLVVMAIPVVWVIGIIVSDARHNRRVRANPDRTVNGIRQRVRREQAAAEAMDAPTEVLPVIQLAPADEPTVELPPVLPKRTRPSAERPRSNPHRLRQPPPADLAARVLQGLRDLDKE